MKAKDLRIEEKVRLLAGKNGWYTEDLGGKLYSVYCADGPIGVRTAVTMDWDENNFKYQDLSAIAYPSAQVLSQTWNPALAYAMGECLADDCIEKGVDVLLGPGVNIKRSPMCGRNFEYFSEDPYVSGVFGREYIKGIQSKHVGATLKHYLANNNEIGRMWASSNVDERTLREMYMRAFEISLEAKPWAVMSSYNLLNGVRVSHNTEYMEILRKELGHGDNLIVSDWGAVKDHVASVKSGTDLEMPIDKKHNEDLQKAYDSGLISEAEIDICADRMIAFAKKAERAHQQQKLTYTIKERRAVAKKIEQEGIVLLKNNGVLPIQNGQSISVAAEILDRYYSGRGSSRVVPEKKVEQLYDCLGKVLPASEIVKEQLRSWNYSNVFTNADGKDVSIITVGFETGEEFDRRTFNLKNWENEDWLIKTLAKRNPNTVVVVYGGGAFDVSEWIDDVAAVVYVGYAGEMGSEAIADVLAGVVTPSGKLTETFAISEKEYPSENIEFDGFNYNYEEKMDVGYRYFDKYPEKVRFPFGFGLSYTKFEYSNISVAQQDGKWFVDFTIKNIGNFDGAEIAQVYVKAIHSKIEKPLKELRGFGKVFLKQGESKKITVQIDDRAFEHYDVESHKWTKDNGEYEILVAENAQSVCLSTRIVVSI